MTVGVCNVPENVGMSPQKGCKLCMFQNIQKIGIANLNRNTLLDLEFMCFGEKQCM